MITQARIMITPPMIKYHFLLLVLAALALSCRSFHKYEEWSTVASVDGGSVARQDMVRAALKSHHIRCYMEGSLAYAVMVPKNRANEARRVLSEDPQLVHKEWLLILQTGGTKKL